MMVVSSAARPLLFVYGTLKQGFYNYDVYLQRAVEQNLANLVTADARTTTAFPLVVQGPRSIPALWNQPGVGHCIQGELYTVEDHRVMQAMDLLEGVATGHYQRHEISVEWKQPADDKLITAACWAYLQQAPVMDAANDDKILVYHRVYTPEMHALYVPPTSEPDPEILGLLDALDKD